MAHSGGGPRYAYEIEGSRGHTVRVLDGPAKLRIAFRLSIIRQDDLRGARRPRWSPAYRGGVPSLLHLPPMLCTFAVGFVRAWDDTRKKSFVQTVFATLWQRHEEFTVTTTLKAYLYSAVRNEALNSLKHRRIVDRAHDSLAATETLPAHSALALSPDLVHEHDKVTASYSRPL